MGAIDLKILWLDEDLRARVQAGRSSVLLKMRGNEEALARYSCPPMIFKRVASMSVSATRASELLNSRMV
jgi:hypothetical protein